MKKILILLALILAQTALKAQTITGTILEAGTDKKLSNVTVYFDGTSNVTSSDAEGNFVLNIRGSDKVPLIASFLGYKNEVITDYLATNKIIIHLKPRPINLDAVEITVGDDGVSRFQKLIRFRVAFLGYEGNARNCVIQNLNDLHLSVSRTGVLTAWADKPLIIHNKSLGYTFHFSLDKFSSSDTSTLFYGQQFFKEDKKVTKAMIRARERTYLGSRMHFIKSLWNNELEKNGFKVFRKTEKDLDYDSIVVSHDGQKYLCLSGRTVILYNNRNSKVSFVTSRSFVIADPGKEILIDKDGYNDPIGITWGGSIGNQRAADLLPLEYNLKSNMK